MKAEQYLRQAERLNADINDKMAELEQLKSLRLSITASLQGAGGGSGGDRLCAITAKILDMEAELNAMIDTYVDLRKEIAETVAMVQDAKLRTLLQKIYLDLGHKPQKVIAMEMHYSRQHIDRLHKQALEAVDVILRKRGRRS